MYKSPDFSMVSSSELTLEKMNHFGDDFEKLEKAAAIVGELTQILDQRRSELALDSQKKRRSLRELGLNLFAHRRTIDAVVGINGLATSPAWDILLDMYNTGLTGKKLSVTAVTVGGDCPPTTALRWLGILVDEGLVERSQDPSDKRRVWVSLTREGEEKVATALRSFECGCGC